MTHIIPEAAKHDLQTIRAQVFLEDVKDALKTNHRITKPVLKYKIEENGSHYVEAWVGGEHRTQCYIHPLTGNPEGVAYLLSCTLKPVVLEGR